MPSKAAHAAARAVGERQAHSRAIGAAAVADDALPAALPADALDDRIAIVGTAGSVKTYAAKGFVERLLDIGARVAIVDPLGVWWGLRASADGSAAGYPPGVASADTRAAEGAAKKQALVEQICTELSAHNVIEEEIFYPGCQGKVEEDLLKEGYVEHDGSKVLIAELISSAPDEEFYDAKVKMLSEQIEHHVHGSRSSTALSMPSGCRTQAGVLPKPRSEALPTFACRAYSSGLPAISAFTTCTM